MFVVMFLASLPMLFRFELGVSVTGALTLYFGVWTVATAAWYSWRRRHRNPLMLAPVDLSDP